MYAAVTEVRDTEALEACRRLTFALKTEIIRNLGRMLQGRRLEPDTLQQFPYLASPDVFLAKYAECFVVCIDPVVQSVSLAIDRDALLLNGLPPDLPMWLEYGEGALPPLPHIRTAMADANMMAEQIARQLWM